MFGLESHVTRRTKRCVSREIKITCQLFGNRGNFHSKGLQKPTLDHVVDKYDIKSEIFSHFNSLFIIKTN